MSAVTARSAGGRPTRPVPVFADGSGPDPTVVLTGISADRRALVDAVAAALPPGVLRTDAVLDAMLA